MKPTILKTDQPSRTLGVRQDPTTTALVVSSKVITLAPERQREVTDEVARASLDTLSPREIAELGYQAERALHTTLDGFLAKLDKNSASRVFDLFERVQKGVDEAKLPDLLKKVMKNDPGLWARLKKLCGSRTAIKDALREAYQATCDLVSGRTKNLADVVEKIENDLTLELERLSVRLADLEQLKLQYGDHLEEFAYAAAVTSALASKARGEVEAKRQEIQGVTDQGVQAKFREMENKLQLLESRALALEGIYTRIPADEEVIRQIQNAGVLTFQEALTTSGQRFANIKMTLLALNGSLEVKGVQQMQSDQARLDQQLSAVRGILMKDVVTTAANAPGDNRLQQAEQIRLIIDEAKQLNTIVTIARAENAKKFETARASFKASREEILKLSQGSK